MIANIDPKTGIAYGYGYISAHALHDDVVQTLQDNGTDVFYEENWQEFIANKRYAYEEELQAKKDAAQDDGREFDPNSVDEFDPEDYRDEFNDSWQPDEPIHEGEYEGVKYRTSWLGGALNVWIFESPHVTEHAGRASPCVPNAGILDSLDGDVQAYDVPPEWRLHPPFVGFSEKEVTILRDQMIRVHGTFSAVLDEFELDSVKENNDRLILQNNITITKYWHAAEGSDGPYYYDVEWTYCISPGSDSEPAQHDTDILAKDLLSLEAAVATVVGHKFLMGLQQVQEWDRERI